MKGLVVLCAIFLSVGVMSLPVSAQINPMCKKNKTIGRSYIHKIDSEFDVVYQGNLYQFADVTGTNPLNTGKWAFHHEKAIFKSTKTSCKIVYADGSSDSATFSDNVPIPVAKAIAMYRVQKGIRMEGRTAVQKYINGAKGLAPEFAYAYKKLGFKITPHIKIWEWGDEK
jgi:hypothetical protein